MLTSDVEASEPVINLSAVLTDDASIILVQVLASVSAVLIFAVMVMVWARREVQPLKIKSPRLMLLSIFANLFIIVTVSII